MNNFFWLTLLLLITSCGSNQPYGDPNKKPESKEKTEKTVFLFVGDSLTAGYGVDIEDCFVSLLKNEFEKSNSPWQIKNAGITGETSAGTLARIDWLIASKPKMIFLCIGSNDGLRGIRAEVFHKNLKEIIEKINKTDIKLILAGVKIPYNYGVEYMGKINAVPETLAKEFSLLYYPFLLSGVAARSELNQDDFVHPNAKGHKVIFENLKSFFKKNDILE
jgi:acyl-CoA thioesterase-1